MSILTAVVAMADPGGAEEVTRIWGVPADVLGWIGMITFWFGAIFTTGSAFIMYKVGDSSQKRLEDITQQSQLAISKAQLQVAEANERTVQLARETEILRQKNLEVEAALSPRSLEFTGEDAAKLKSYNNVRWFMVAARRDEPQDTAAQIAFLLGQAGWEKFDGTPPLVDAAATRLLQGISIHISSLEMEPAARALAALLNASQIETIVHVGGRTRLSAMGQNGILIQIGQKHTLSAVRMRRAAEEQFEQHRKESLEEIYKMHPELRNIPQ